MATEGFQQHLKTLQQQVEAALLRSLQGRPWPQPLAQAVEYSLMAGGKRLRPVLVLLASDLCGGLQAAALSPACAIEMIHTYSLIHDDLPAMDDDDLRRGRPTVHKAYGEPLALLTGDALIIMAYQTLAQSGRQHPMRTVQLMSAISDGVGAPDGIDRKSTRLNSSHRT